MGDHHFVVCSWSGDRCGDLDCLSRYRVGIAAIELELQALVGRSVDLRTPADLSRYFRDAVTAEARQLYDAA